MPLSAAQVSTFEPLLPAALRVGTKWRAQLQNLEFTTVQDKALREIAGSFLQLSSTTTETSGTECAWPSVSIFESKRRALSARWRVINALERALSVENAIDADIDLERVAALVTLEAACSAAAKLVGTTQTLDSAIEAATRYERATQELALAAEAIYRPSEHELGYEPQLNADTGELGCRVFSRVRLSASRSQDAPLPATTKARRDVVNETQQQQRRIETHIILWLMTGLVRLIVLASYEATVVLASSILVMWNLPITKTLLMAHYEQTEFVGYLTEIPRHVLYFGEFGSGYYAVPSPDSFRPLALVPARLPAIYLNAQEVLSGFIRRFLFTATNTLFEKNTAIDLIVLLLVTGIASYLSTLAVRGTLTFGAKVIRTTTPLMRDAGSRLFAIADSAESDGKNN